MNFTPSQITDIAIVVFLLVCAICGAAKGLFKALVKLAVLAASVFAGYFLAPAVTPRLVEMIYPNVSEKLAEFASEKLGLKLSLFPQEQIDQLLKPMLYNPVKICVWVVVAIVAFILLSLIVNFVDSLINKTPGVKQLNRTAGGILGLVIGLLVCVALAMGICYSGLDTLLDEKIGDSVAYTIFTEIIPEKVSQNGSIINIDGVGEIDLSEIDLDVLKNIELPVAGEKTENLVNQIFDFLEKDKTE